MCIPAAAFQLHRGDIGRKAVLSLIGAALCFCAEGGGRLLGNVFFGADADISVFAARVMAPDIFLALSLTEMLIADRADIVREKLKNLSLLVIIFDLIHLVFLVFYWFTEKGAHAEINCLIQLVFLLLLFSIFFVQYRNVMRMRRLMEIEKEYETVRKEIENNRRYYALADLQYRDISKLRHDIQNHFSAVKELLKKREESEDEAKLIMYSISRRLDALGTLEFCSNRRLNALLTVKLNDKLFKDISLKIDLKDIEKSPLADNDLCGIISEMLDAASGCCMKADENGRKLELTAFAGDGGFRIRTDSTFPESSALPEYEVSRLICETDGGSFTARSSGGQLTAEAVLNM